MNISIYQCLVLIVLISGYIDTNIANEQQPSLLLIPELKIIKDITNTTTIQAYKNESEKIDELITNKDQQIVLIPKFNQYSNTNTIQDLIQSNQENEQQKNGHFPSILTSSVTNNHPFTIFTTNSTDTSFNSSTFAIITSGIRRKKKSLSPSSPSTASLMELNDDDNNDDDDDDDDENNNNNYDDYLNIKNSNFPVSSEEEEVGALTGEDSGMLNENYAYEDINENYKNADIISSSNNPSDFNNHHHHHNHYQHHHDDQMNTMNNYNEYEKNKNDKIEIGNEQQWQHNNNLKESFQAHTSSIRSDSTNNNNDNNDNNKRILSNDQPYLMMNKGKLSSSTSSLSSSSSGSSASLSQINKLLYTKEFYLKQGNIKGIIRTFHPQSGLRDVNQFLGIPYAEAPVGNRRFLPPGVPLPWSGLKIASHLPPVCPQNLPNPNLANVKLPKGRSDQLARLLPYLKNENEDCLYLNVYVPQRDRYDKYEKYPVIVYIHGESYEWNSGNPYDGSVLASYGQVIVVTINYRLGILGFMKPGISQTTVSNFGLFDQIAALKWIKDNIESFGGDANSVTLMGHSTGAACANLLMVSPVANGLFHRAILMSGSAMADWATTNHSIHLTMQIANGVNCFTTDDDEKMLKCLRSKKYQDFLKVSTALPPFITSIGPIVDEIIIPNQPYKMMSQITENFGKYDLLFGVTELESYHVLDSMALEEGLTEKERDQFLRLYMNSRYEIRPDLAMAATLKQYMDVYNNPSKATKHEHRDVFLDILSDARIVGPLLQTGLFHADVNPRNYMYVFGHNSASGPYASLPHSVVGEELAFVFGAPLAAVGPFHQKYSTSEKLLSEAVMTYWTNFAKTGNPKAPWKGDFINSHRMEWANYDIDWPEFNKRNQCFVNIGIPPSLEMKYRSIYMNFWNKELPNELNEIASMQKKPKIHFYPPTNSINNNNGPANHRNPNYNRNDEIIAGHIQKYPSNFAQSGPGDGGINANTHGSSSSTKVDNPIHELKMLMKKEQEHMGYGGGEGSFENHNHNNNNNNNNNGYSPVDNMLNAQPTFGITHYNSADSISSSSSGNDGATIPVVNYSNEAGEEMSRDILRSESALHILIGLIVLFLILNILIYSTFLFKRKKKNANQLNRKLGGFISYDGTNDDDLKRSKTNDGDESYIMDMVKQPNGYDFIKTKNITLNGFKITRQLSTSTVDAHTKVSDWMSNDNDKNSTVTKSSIKTSPSFSLRGRSFFRRPQKVSVSIDATPQARSDSILRQEPIEVSKYKGMDNTRSIIICQEIDVDSEMLQPETYNNNADYPGYGYSAVRNPIHDQDRRYFGEESQYISAFNNPPLTYTDEQVTSFIDDNRSDLTGPIHTKRNSNEHRDQLTTLLAVRNYQNIILPNTISNDEKIKRQSLPINTYNSFLNKMPPLPPPRTISTLGRKPSYRESSADITTSPLALAKDCNSDEVEEPKITENTLIVGPLLPKSQESIYSTLKRKNRQQQQQQQDNQIKPLETDRNQLVRQDSVNQTTIEICIENNNDEKQSKPSGIKPPTIFPQKIPTSDDIDINVIIKENKPKTPINENNQPRMALLGLAAGKVNKNQILEKSKIPQLKTIETTTAAKQQKSKDKSKSVDSSSSESSSSNETVKTEFNQIK